MSDSIQLILFIVGGLLGSLVGYGMKRYSDHKEAKAWAEVAAARNRVPMKNPGNGGY